MTDRLFEAAFAYKKTKLWKELFEDEFFAVRMDDGEIGYLSVMGSAGEYCALALYIGEEGVQSYWKTLHLAEYMMLPDLIGREMALSQKSYHLAFEAKDELMDDEIAAARAYAKTHKIRLFGKNAYPHFIQYEPNRHPWKLYGEKDESYLLQGIRAACAVAEMLRTTASETLGIVEIDHYASPIKVPLMELTDQGYRFTGMVTFPEETEEETYAQPKTLNELAIRKLKKAKKTGAWECMIFLYPNPIQDDPEEAPYYPHMLAAVSSDTGFMLTPFPVKEYEKNPEEMVDALIDQFIMQKMRPGRFQVCDDRTYYLLRPLASALKIPISIEPELPALDDALESMQDYLGRSPEDEMANMMGIIEEIINMPPEVAASLPEELKDQLEIMLDLGVLPPDLEDALAEKLGLD